MLLCPINFSFLLSLVGSGLDWLFKYLRTLIKVGFVKATPITLLYLRFREHKKRDRKPVRERRSEIFM